jgi:hypothetical protein
MIYDSSIGHANNVLIIVNTDITFQVIEMSEGIPSIIL